MRRRTRLALALIVTLMLFTGACDDGSSPSAVPSISTAGVDPGAVEGLWHLVHAESGGRWVDGNDRGEFTVTIDDGVVVADGVCNQLVAAIAFEGDRVFVTNGGVTEAGCPREELDLALEEVFFTAVVAPSVVERADDGAFVLVGEGTRLELSRSRFRP